MLAKSGRFSSSQSVIRVCRSSDVDKDSGMSEDLSRYLCCDHGISMGAGHDRVGDAIHVDGAAVAMVKSTR